GRLARGRRAGARPARRGRRARLPRVVAAGTALARLGRPRRGAEADRSAVLRRPAPAGRLARPVQHRDGRGADGEAGAADHAGEPEAAAAPCAGAVRGTAAGRGGAVARGGVGGAGGGGAGGAEPAEVLPGRARPAQGLTAPRGAGTW